MTRKPKPPSPEQKKNVLPDLSDESLVQIRNFLHLALDVFEDHYGQQLDLGVRRKTWTGLCRKSKSHSVFEGTE